MSRRRETQLDFNFKELISPTSISPQGGGVASTAEIRKSPWEVYKELYELRYFIGSDPDTVTGRGELYGAVIVGERKEEPFGVVAVRKFSENNAEKELDMFKKIEHHNFMSASEVFKYNGSIYVAVGHMPLSLNHIIASHVFPSEIQLAAIIGQIFNGIEYLASMGLEHGYLSCSNILLSAKGEIKIAHQELCRASPHGQAESRNVKALGGVITYLMEKCAEGNDSVGVGEPKRWSCKVLGFLSEVQAGVPIVDLRKHPLLQLDWTERALEGIAVLAQGGSALCLLLPLSHPNLRKPSYEVFLRAHQALAMLSAVATWKHLTPSPLLYTYIIGSMFLSILVIQSVLLIYRNTEGDGSLPKVHIESSNDVVDVTIRLSRPVKVEAGQYINVWIPSVCLWSFMQSHPFVVASWSEGEQKFLYLLIEPRKGFTQKLLDRGKAGGNGVSKNPGVSFTFENNRRSNVVTRKLNEIRSIWSHLVLLSGPHGVSAPVGKYEIVLMVASGFGVVSLLPYIRKLMYGFNAGKIRTRRIHLVWHLEEALGKILLYQINMLKLTNAGIALRVQNMLQDALEEDDLRDPHIFNISVYGAVEIKWGKSSRAYKGKPNLGEIVKDEATGIGIERVQDEQEERGKLLAMVSGSDDLRYDLRRVIRDHLEKVTLLELEFQPGR
ncbi:hypothetical protein GP486_002245 [Trichoglossum hirsutum]|uniref:ferric-chelate reductase (NADPH) n=1 Tax=Trichoglossum hirsutum TaxID=265104 RepID=A0A9P8LFD0_9PEZI|nr:hypothetical protein GP486_002245 [Trichoglossum hirsutum]